MNFHGLLHDGAAVNFNKLPFENQINLNGNTVYSENDFAKHEMHILIVFFFD